ncbi:MAG: efflux RND transporter periplasmic adaptor subunit [Isosphaeraceae bacterium]
MSISMLLGRVVLPTSAVLLAIALAWQWVQGVAAVRTGQPSTRMEADASVEAGLSADRDLVGRVKAEGRVVAYPGAEVTVGTEVLGTIVSMPVGENASVRKGDLLVEFRADEVRASLREAHARLTEAAVGLRLEQARSGLDRVLPRLAGPSQTPQAIRDNLAAATARRDAARADVDRLEAEAAKYRILAPIDGVVVARQADPGETVSPGAPLLTIVDLTRVRVEAEVDEFDIPRITPRAGATITAEGYRGRRWRGEVEEVAAVVVARQTRPADPGRPADTRVLLVKVRFEEPNPLKLGQRVEVEIDGP